MVSVSSSGQSGPDSHFAGYAPLFGAWGGLGYLTGYGDGPPVEMRHVMDHSLGLNAALATLAALHRRRRTGDGSHVDVAGREVASSLAGEALLQAAAGGQPQRVGNTEIDMAPYGVYRTRDNDRWITIAVGSDAEWEAFVRVIDRPNLAADLRFATAASRYRHRELLDTEIEAWTMTHDGQFVANAFQSAGVPAHVSWTAKDIVNDPHLRARGMIVDVPDEGGDMRAAVSVPVRLSKSTTGMERTTPKLGEDEGYVFGELLGLTSDERAILVADQVIY